MGNKTNEDLNLKIGLLLQKAREDKNVTQKEIAEYTGYSKNHISAVERGVCKASVELLLGYCDLLDVEPNIILDYKTSI